MFRIFPLILFVLNCTFVFGNNPKIDSLKRELQTTKNPEVKVQLNRMIGSEFLNNKKFYDSAFYYAERAYDIALDENLESLQARSLLDQGLTLYAMESFEKSIEYYERSILISKKINSAKAMAYGYGNIGASYSALDQREKAREVYKLALEMAKKANVKNVEANIYANLGALDFADEDYINAEKKIVQSFDLFKSTGGVPGYVYSYLGKTYKKLNKLEISEEYTKQGLKRSRKEGNLQIILEDLFRLAELKENAGDFEKANEYHKRAMALQDSITQFKTTDLADKMELMLHLKEKETQLENLEQKNKLKYTIYILLGIGIILLGILISRQLKIVRMTKNIHEIQNTLIKTELDKRQQSQSKSSFEATREGDKRFN